MSEHDLQVIQFPYTCKPHKLMSVKQQIKTFFYNSIITNINCMISKIIHKCQNILHSNDVFKKKEVMGGLFLHAN